jgi:hypothetical protein
MAGDTLKPSILFCCDEIKTQLPILFIIIISTPVKELGFFLIGIPLKTQVAGK